MKTLIFIFFFLASAVFGGGGGIETSGGGVGVLLDGRIQLLDLVEAGVDSSQLTIQPPILDNPFYSRLWTLNLFSKVDKQILTFYLDRLWEKDAFLADGIVQTLLLYQWNFVPNPLHSSPPDTVITNPLFQMALRKGASVYIDLNLFEKLDPISRIALVVHEAVSALAEPGVPEIRSREIVGDLFSKNFSDTSAEEFKEVLGSFYISKWAVRQHLAMNFIDNANLQKAILNGYTPQTTTKSSSADYTKQLAFTPILHYESKSKTGVSKWKTLFDLEQELKECNEEGVYDVTIYDYVLHLRPPAQNGDFAPFVSWDLKQEIRNKIDSYVPCSPRSRSMMLEVYKELKQNFIFEK